jgi:hypothetical protein
VSLQDLSAYFHKIEDICKTRNGISHLTKLNLQYMVESWKRRFSQEINNTQRCAEETTSTEQLHTGSAALVEVDKTDSSHVVCT